MLKLSVYLMKAIPILNIHVKFISMKTSLFPEEGTIMFHFYFLFLGGQHVYLCLWLKFTCNMQSKMEGQGFQEICFLQSLLQIWCTKDICSLYLLPVVTLRPAEM